MTRDELSENINTIDNGKIIDINNKSKNINLSAITHSEKWEYKDHNDITIVTYSFSQSISQEYHGYRLKNDAPISALNQFQISQTRIAMQSISDVADIRFIEVDEGINANIPIVNVHPAEPINVAGYAHIPSTRNLTPVCINADSSENLIPTQSNFGGHVFTHEILHALGLKHTHDTAGLTQRSSVMSYRSEWSSGANYDGHYASMPQLYDITALQYLYGANMNTRTGNDIYTYFNHTPILCIWDAGGIDTFDFSDQTQDLVINLAAGSFSNVGGLVGNISIAYGVVIENAIGGSGNDELLGNEGVNVLAGGGGDDKLSGGGDADHLWSGKGHDTFVYCRAEDSLTTSADTIHDFEAGKDKIDLSALSLPENKIRLADKLSFSGYTEIVHQYDDISNITYLMIDFDPQVSKSDMMIKLTGRHQLSLNDFIFTPQIIA
ncbi:Peptidase M10 serralysin [Yersinia aldovae]|uniref:M10 family metallopeptidase C-terminal domain-containing protein n=1 Tax=Yersinia aldovae TaxID=29483 RepID=UPI0005E456CB|nr:M10 family metallopeptidase C-terminal domain-containing protein [Yersinia aldovae]CNH30397.1 Peptidase M10 serralysin [Yersinia aldovae]